MNHDERLQAHRILMQLLRNHTPLSHSMQSVPLTAFSKDICFGVCRYYFRLQAIADHLLNKRPKDMDVWCCLLIGLYQLHHQHIPDYAVVKETVSLLDKIKKPWAKSLVNAVLRNYCRKQEEILTTLKNDATFQNNHPEWLSKRLQTAWPKDWQKILAANDTHPPMSLRVNRQQDSVETYVSRLQTAGIQAETLNYATCGLRLTTPCDVKALPGFTNGDVSVQDEAAQLAVSLLDLKPGLRLLDACCAPGGKTCHILESQPHLAVCMALDVDGQRMQRVRENLERLKLHATLVEANALDSNTWWDGKPFDRILLDAPCSAIGVIRRHPDIKLLRTPADLNIAIKLQQNLLHALWPLLAPGGIMIYATCSIIPEENELQIAQFIKSQKDCRFLAEKKSDWGRETGHGWQILPGEHNMDGFFYSALGKIG
ncbi:16S rRNA (cytosine(967)-C(5))-methyltransferase RsmB [Legionella oakridgensis]|uniref:16S rRNA (cytosine(967)-C(5))-methyltransferase n=2 Tax=Legionella oakridgensis TaxID=29423 RepID=W0BC15_9GAMM|nr:16S rRNA (cytosine(967)-C(5))-methyltransferase RsmB [Legionella oakridgensis]AHE66167.1 ribosomal RNA small, subunit methyltransferase RsmB [Legionella oakridgensis ATCC 33761 = DSM 21215]ETO94030.1 16S rRNA m(5)C-967 methyltransferase [Legionella oakridgensis RV-2-2007]KTD43907.1 rRNA methyltransferase [Legionella oakridgensis]STY16075.1 Sun protein [Legionella longbeachae]